MALPRFSVCTKCNSPLAGRVWCEPTQDGKQNCLWSCPACGNEFESVEDSAVLSDELNEAVDAFWPTLLVA